MARVFRMRGIDDGRPAPGFVTWTSINEPDYAGAYLTGLVGSLILDSVVVQSERQSQDTGWRAHDNTFEPVGLWQFDRSLADLSGNGFTLSVGAGSEQYTQIVPGLWAAWLGGSSYFTLAHQTALTILGEVTVEAIVRRQTWQAASQEYFCTYAANAETEVANALWGLSRTAAGESQMFWEQGAGSNVNSVASGIVLPESAPFHWAISRTSDGGIGFNVAHYVNGILVGTSTSLAAPTGGSTSTLFVGTNETAALTVSQTAVSSLKVVARGLSAEEVLQEYLYVTRAR